MTLFVLFHLVYFTSCQKSGQGSSPENWAAAGGNPGQTKYSELDQINKANVAELAVAWTYRSGDTTGNVQVNPLIIDGTMYVTTPAQELIAIDAANGKEVWRYNPARKGETFGGTNRGIGYWQAPAGEESRLYFTSGNYLNAVNSKTGEPIASFGDNGRIDLNADLVRPAADMSIFSPAAPVIYQNTVVAGAASWSAPANVSGFDVTTGKRVWIFNTIPKPNEYGYHTWGNKKFWRDGAGANAWGGLSVDTESGIVYFSTGQPKDDFYRSDNEGEQLFGNSIVALNATNGTRIWHYQAIHHDLWDLDLPCAPILVNLKHKGKKVKGVMQLSKTGYIFLFNRITGELLSEVEERPVPPSDLPGEYAYPTQPYVTWPEPFAKQVVTANDLTNRTPEAYAYAKKVFDEMDAGWYIPPSEKGILYYGIHGGAEWGGGAYDHEENTVYINSNELAWQIKMKDLNATASEDSNRVAVLHPGNNVYLKMGCAYCHGAKREGQGSRPRLTGLEKKYSEDEVFQIIRNGRKGMPAFSQIPDTELRQLSQYLLDKDSAPAEKAEKKGPEYRSLGYVKFLDPDGYPATAPPWGTLNAVDLTTGKIKWKVPLGEYEELTKAGMPVTGTENFGGSIVTKGGLVFIGATRDEKFRAFDKETGKVLWEVKLPYGGYATPSTYAVNGKQYVVIPATGGGKLGGPTGDTYVAFALPDSPATASKTALK
ncbi:pyrroloquinoline quinone-dependent dehydrogenase [Pontibacter sp. 13R65]|uniref:pyrroloquinoline quinone-dependent dehydrogenase n=1 Tax=Pontibacter sp. 13R65 TaxID=3127458 RepID=UPI00301D2013